MLRFLQIKNFKGWKDTGLIEMAPITLFFGTNSSGKSSIGQFLMLLKQTAESQDRKSVLNPGGNNTAVELGSYKDMIYEHNVKNKLSFLYAWDMPTSIYTPHGNEKYMSFKATIGIMGEKNSIPAVDGFSYRLIASTKDYSMAGVVFSLGIEREGTSDNYKLIGTKDAKPVARRGRLWPLKNPIRFYGFPEEIFTYYQGTSYIEDLQFQHTKLFSSIHYLGPLRTKTNRIYSWSGTNPQDVGYAGENTIPAILAARDRSLNLGPKKRYHKFETIIANELEYMGLIDSFKVRRLIEESKQYEVKLKTNKPSSYVDLPDVGFGISQVLPVIVQCFYAPENSIIIIEQPEIHLHPKAQAALADVLIDVILSSEKYKHRNIQLIIETHSEHFLRRLQRRIADETISETDVKAYFADNSASTAKLEKLQIDEYGNINNWPDNFFGDEMGDIAEHTKAMMKRRMEKK